MRHSYVPSPDGPGGFGKLVNDETGDLISFGKFYAASIERDKLQSRCARLEAALRSMMQAYEGCMPDHVNADWSPAYQEAAAALSDDAGKAT